MARRTGRRSGGERVLESRHLIGLFLGVVVLCAVFFSLGYVMGKSQYSGLVHAAYSPGHGVSQASLTEKADPKADSRADVAAPPPSGEWDFYSNKANNHLDPVPQAIAPVAPKHPAGSAPVAAPVDRRLARLAEQSAHYSPAKMLGGSIVLQVAAVTQQGDALSMADALQRKKFPSFVVAPSSDRFYRVQVGPYNDERAADNAKSALDHAGFKAIIKR